MQKLIWFIQHHPTEMFFNLSAIMLCFVVARVLRAPPPLALAFSFTPVVMGLIFSDPTMRTLVLQFF
jgi:hypothetical protein